MEAGGAEVVPIHYMTPKEELLVLLDKLNGVLFPGGGNPINIENKWTQTADTILQYAIRVNKEHPNKPFPLWGTCLGHELLLYLTGGKDRSILGDVENQHGTINTIRIENEQSRLLHILPAYLKKKLSAEPGVEYYYHVKAIL